MPTTFTKGDLFSAEGTKAYAHGCNLEGTMDTGVSVAFKKKWPRMFEEYAAACAAKSLRLGDVFAFRDGEQVVYTLAIQEQAASKGKWPALIGALEKMVELAQADGIDRVALSRIGTGSAGLDWTRVKKILSEVGEKTSVSLLVFEQFVRTV